MRLKYFIRGLGTGILSSTIILMILFSVKGPKVLTDAEILQKAQKIEKSSTEYNLKLKKDSKEKSTTNNKDSKESTKKNNTTESKTNKIQNQGTENGQDTSSNKNEITVVVKKGETLKEICDELQDKGVVKSSESMRHFMVEKGYDSFLHAGSFNVKKGMSEDEIGKIFSK